jgi:hypothetical protein
VAACWTLWLSGSEAACPEECGLNGVALTGATAAAALTADGALCADAELVSAELLENDEGLLE